MAKTCDNCGRATTGHTALTASDGQLFCSRRRCQTAYEEQYGGRFVAGARRDLMEEP